MTRPINCDSRPRHEEAQLALFRMIADLRIILNAGDQPDTSTRQHCVAIIADARADVERCTSSMDKMIKHLQYRPVDQGSGIADFQMMDHMALVDWLTELSMDLKLIDIRKQRPQHNELPIRSLDEARLSEGQRLVNELDSCREQLRRER